MREPRWLDDEEAARRQHTRLIEDGRDFRRTLVLFGSPPHGLCGDDRRRGARRWRPRGRGRRRFLRRVRLGPWIGERRGPTPRLIQHAETDRLAKVVVLPLLHRELAFHLLEFGQLLGHAAAHRVDAAPLRVDLLAQCRIDGGRRLREARAGP